MTIEMILRAFEALKDGKGNPDDPLPASVMRLFDVISTKVRTSVRSRN
jgi:hypothetical protein